MAVAALCRDGPGHDQEARTVAADQGRGKVALKRDEIGMNRHRASGCCLSMIFSEDRCALFRIML
ncbi:hypothetical protein GPL20_03285 [Bradyrhizobium cajani]|uniref:Uncharacterized protein n=1 Tax=Bradyrhizobium cajani TaxID=1928661 RepID=A0A844TAN6_9BRAD|nr:hypothetical protein [Bradyrhizobium cajani]